MVDGANSGYSWQVVSGVRQPRIGSIPVSIVDFGIGGAMEFTIGPVDPFIVYRGTRKITLINKGR